CQQYNIWSSF
nr:immunoglobulin light chain junction region [Macaca mulatta]MOX52523.1 immunoglobulin light chain junction region [Macaca mulatta]MOX52859.1 immunoglobulin light chain junction region [Macaca mulatta]MOX55314.1 immunoglobulin light chain junction region [Macaca mulatta]MOX55324.1 immunoglobulin light chain junction region [Macaca mulatta]